MNQWRPLRVSFIGLQDNFGRVVTTNMQCWGYEVTVNPATLMMDAGPGILGEVYALEGDVLLYDLDVSFHPWMMGKDSPVLQQSEFTTDGFCLSERQWPRPLLTIALSSRSVSRTVLEQIGAIALLQKPFAMGHLQRYLQVLHHLLCSDVNVQKSSDGPMQENVRVLVVDDDVDIAHAIRQCLLYESGYEVAVAHDGLDALEQCLDWHPECIVTDLIMPWMSGYQVMRCLSLGVQQMTPAFVVMSALTPLEGPVDRAYLEGRSVVYVNKPFHIDRLLSAIKRVCAG